MKTWAKEQVFRREVKDYVSITVRYFASLREQIGVDTVEIDPEEVLCVADVWRVATSNMAMPERLLFAVNHAYALLDSVVKDGDEVAFFPPVTGG